MKTINIAKDFSKYPGPRHRTNGEHSGEEFYEILLEPFFKDLGDEELLKIEFDGTYGYPASFVSEAFGRLYKNHGGESIRGKLELISNNDPILVDFIYSNAAKYE